MTETFDDREIQPPEMRERALFDHLPGFLASIASSVPGWAARLKDIDTNAITSRDALARLPVLRKPELMEAQTANPPFGGFVDPSMLNGARMFMSPGPVWEPQAPGPDPWSAARSFFAAGIRPGDLVHNALSYHMTPGGFILDEGARALGARLFPAGVGNTEQQVEAASQIKPDAYAGTPDFLKVMLDKADEMGKDLSSIRKAIVSGGALFPSMREEYKSRGVNVMQAYATADLGVIAFETSVGEEPLPGMICNEDMIVEVVRPGTDDPVAHGEVGELVVTSFNPAYPLIRFGTGDLSAILDEPSPCGRTNLRIKGWMGRADQRTKVKGMFVDPKHVDAVIKKHPSIERARLIVSRQGARDVMVLKVKGTTDINTDAVSAELAAVTKLKGTVELATDIPNDGKVIDDQRDYSQ